MGSRDSRPMRTNRSGLVQRELRVCLAMAKDLEERLELVRSHMEHEDHDEARGDVYWARDAATQVRHRLQDHVPEIDHGGF